MAKTRPADPAALFDDDTGGQGGLGLLLWGFATVIAVVLGYASWQFAPAGRTDAEATRTAALPSADDVTGSIGDTDAGTTAPNARTVGATRFPATPIGASEPPVTKREIEQLRADLRDLQRRIVQMGMSGDGVSRRLDRLEERLDGLVASRPAPPKPVAEAAPTAPEPSPQAEPSEPPGRVAAVPSDPTPVVTVKVPHPRPEIDQPAVTGSLPPKTAPGKTDREPAAPPPQPALPPAEAAAKPTAPATPAATIAAVDVGGYRSLVTLKKSWSDMSERYAEFGKGVEPLARLRETDSGMEARLVVGPYANQSEAAKTCLRMRALGVNCAVTGYTGQPLSALR